jgi:CheY-like chemotaxis protein
MAERDETTILVAADADWVRAQVRAAFVGRGQRVVELKSGFAVRAAVAESPPDLVVLDMQIGNMGGVAVAIDLHLEAAAGRLDDVPILLLLDRAADTFLARRAEADAELVKPVDAGTLRRTAKRLLAEWQRPDEQPDEPVDDTPAPEPAAAGSLES